MIPFVIVTAVFVALALGVEISPSIHMELPEGSSDREASAALERFDPGEVLLVSYPAADLYAPDALAAVNELHDALSRTEGIASVTSVVSVADLEVSGDELRFVPLIELGPVHLRERIETTRIFREHLVSADGSSWSMWVVPLAETNPAEFARAVTAAVSKFPPAVGYGDVLLEAEITDTLENEAVVLIAAGVLISFLVFWRITRRLTHSALLWAASSAPTVWTLGCFALLGVPITVFALPVPLLVLALSTSYSIHLYEYASAFPEQPMEETLTRAAPTIAAAAGTTALGMSTLFLTGLPMLRTFGLLLVCGVAFAFLVTLFALPGALSRIARTVPRVRRPHGRPIWRRRFAGLLLVAVVPLGLYGATRVYTSGAPEAILWPHDELLVARRDLNRRYGGVDPMDIIIDTHTEYGLIDPRTYAAVHDLVESLRSHPEVRRVISFTDFVNWASSRMIGRDEPYLPGTVVEIGETLELIGGRGGRFSIRSLLDPTYSTARLTVLSGDGAGRLRDEGERMAALAEDIRRTADRLVPEASIHLTGYRMRRQAVIDLLVNSQVRSVVVFIGCLALLLLAIYRSFRWMIICLVPSIAGIAVFFGIAGTAGIALNALSTAMLAALMGVSVDDVIYVTLFYRRERRSTGAASALALTLTHAGRAAVQTTTIICLAVLPLTLSRYQTFFAHVLLLVPALATATFCTLTVVPWLITRYSEADAGDQNHHR